MRRRKWFALLLCLTLAAALLAGCGGEAREQKSEEKKETVAEEPKVNAEDFYGCWEYASMDCWMYIYSDGSFEWFYEDGSSVTGEYAMDGEKLCLTDYDLSFTLDGEGGLVDSDGDVLFQSALPDFVDPPYFEANGIMINYLLGQGDVSVPDAASYFEANTEGRYYNTAPLVCAISMDGEEHLGNGYIRRYYTLYRGFQDSEVPMFGNGVMLGSGYFFYDYYSGLHLPDNEYFKMGREAISILSSNLLMAGWIFRSVPAPPAMMRSRVISACTPPA